MEFPTPTGNEAMKLEAEEILEVLKVSMQAPGSSRNLQKPVFVTKSSSQKHLRKLAQLVKATLREDGSARPSAKQAKKFIMIGDEIPHNVIQMAKYVTIASTMGIATTQQMSARSR
eukprot:6753528-Ditylum_brightwellii.AAC.1